MFIVTQIQHLKMYNLWPVLRTSISGLARYVALKDWVSWHESRSLLASLYHHGDLCCKPNLVGRRSSAKTFSLDRLLKVKHSFLAPPLTIASPFVGVPVDLGARIVQGSLETEGLSGQIQSLGIV